MKRGKLKKSKAPKKPALIVDFESTQVPVMIAKPIPPFSFRVTVREYTRLREGDIVPFGEFNTEHVVIQVNASNARIIPVGSGTKTVTFTPRFSDKPVAFTAPVKTDPIAISANSELPILRRLGPQWREKLKLK